MIMNHKYTDLQPKRLCKKENEKLQGVIFKKSAINFPNNKKKERELFRKKKVTRIFTNFFFFFCLF